MAEISIREQDGTSRNAQVELTGNETAEELISIFGLNTEDYVVKAGGRALRLDELVPLRGTIVVERKSQMRPILWQNPMEPRKIALTLAIHLARSGSQTVATEVLPNVTPHQLADTLVKQFGGVNPNDITHMVDSQGRNLMERQYQHQSFRDLGVQSGESLDIQGDIVQGD